MVQEIITYIIIAFAITIAVHKITKKFRRKKFQPNQYLNNEKTAVLPKCDACSAECILRDLNTPVAKGNDLCKKITVTSNKF